MSHYHGWALIREAYDREEDLERFEQIWQDLSARVEEEQDVNRAFGLLRQNDNLQFWCAAHRNHVTGDAKETIELYQYIAEIAPGSFGLLYIWDDENPEEWPVDRFVVYVLRKGTVTRMDDPFLSPIDPMIEEDYEIPLE